MTSVLVLGMFFLKTSVPPYLHSCTMLGHWNHCSDMACFLQRLDPSTYMKARPETKTKDNRALGPWGLWIEMARECKTACFGVCWCALWPVSGDTLPLTNQCVCLHLGSRVCYLHIRHVCYFFLAVWRGVQRTTGGPGRFSKEGRENQRVGREDPGPGVPGKSIKRNPTTLWNSVTSPGDLCTVHFPKKKIFNVQKHFKSVWYELF